MELNYLDIIIISYSGFVLVWSIFFYLWQIGIINGSEYWWGKVLTFQDIIETIVFVMTRFLPYGIWGTRALCVAYCLHIIGLILQLVFAEWDGIMWKIQASLWLTFYIVMIFIDIAHIDIISLILNRTIEYIEENAYFIKKIGLKNCIELSALFIGKLVNFFKQNKN